MQFPNELGKHRCQPPTRENLATIVADHFNDEKTPFLAVQLGTHKGHKFPQDTENPSCVGMPKSYDGHSIVLSVWRELVDSANLVGRCAVIAKI